MAARHAADQPHRRRAQAPTRFATGLLGGLAVWTSFPPLNWWVAAWIGVAALALSVRGASRRVAALTGWLFGVAMFVPMLSFLRGLGIDAWFVLALAEAGWFALLALALRTVMRLRVWPLAVPTLWVAEEFGRDRVPFGGFPWGRLAFGQAHGPLLPLAAVGGAVAVTFAAALVAGLLAWLLVALRLRVPTALRPRVPTALRLQVPTALRSAPHRPAHGPAPIRAHRWLAVGGALAGIGACLAGAAAITLPTAGTTTAGPSHAVVAVVQGNVPRLGLEAFAQRRAVTADHLAETRALAADIAAGRVPRPQLVIWPENASDQDPYVDPVARDLIEQAVQAVGVPIVVGAVLDGPGPNQVRNAAIVWSPTAGPGEVYVKRHLVPFGEYLPLRSLLHGLVGQLSLVGNFVPGHRPGVLRAGPAVLADVICFEVADDGVVRDAVLGGGRLITVQTNNATYEHKGDDGFGGETAQQLEMSRLRAVEHGRAVVVAATSGVSAVIAPNGTVLARSGVFTPARLVTDVPLRDPRTVADRLGEWPERGVAGLGILSILAAAVRRRRSAPAAQIIADQRLAPAGERVTSP